MRIAQEAIEDWRAFSSIPSAAGQMAYADIDTSADATVADYTTNTTYTLTRTVNEEFGQNLKSIQVVVSWTDRNGQAQRVELDSSIARVDPALRRHLVAAAGGHADAAAARPQPRHPAGHGQQGGGKSTFMPPGSPVATVVWVFDNLTGVIVGVCNTWSRTGSC